MPWTRDDRALLQNAAVLGKSFTTEALAAVTGQDPENVRASAPRADPAGVPAPGGGSALTRTGAVRVHAEPDPRGCLWHPLEGGPPERATSRSPTTSRPPGTRSSPASWRRTTSRHSTRHLSGPDADALAARARDWLTQASDRAVSLGSPEQAFAFTEQALQLTEDGDERRTLLKLAADAARDAVRSDDRERYLRDAAELARIAGDPIDEAQILGRLMDAFFDADNKAAIVELGESMVTRLGAAAEPTIRVEVATATEAIAYLRGDYEESLRSLDEQLALLESLEDTPRLMRTVTRKAITLGLVGRHREASVLMRGEVETVRRGDDLRQLVESLGSASLVLAGDDPRGAFDALLEAISVARKAGYGTSEIHDPSERGRVRRGTRRMDGG